MLPTPHLTSWPGRADAYWHRSFYLLSRQHWLTNLPKHALVYKLGVLGVVFSLLTLVSVALQPARSLAQSCSAKKILFVGSTAPLEARDEPLRIYLFALGNEVTVRSAAAVQPTDANGKDLIIISESAESVEVHTKLRDVALPIITWEGWLQDDLAMTGVSDSVDYGENLRQQTIRIVKPDHPLAAGLTGVVTTVTNDRNKFHWGRPNANATIVAVDVANAQHATIYAYEQGALMVGRVAPAHRIFIHNATGPNLSIDGWRLFDAAVAWAVDCNGPKPTATPTLVPTTFPTATPTVTTTATSTPSATPTFGVTPTASVTPTGTQPTPTRTPTATKTPQPVRLTIEKQDYLFVDADEDGFASPGDTLLYSIAVHNGDNRTITAIRVEDTLDGNTTLLAGTVRTDVGNVVTGNQPGDSTVVVDVGTLAANQSVKILFQAQIATSRNPAQIGNQAQLYYTAGEPSGQGQIASDDPDTPIDNDVTITVVGNPATQQPRRLYLPLIAKTT